MKITVISKNNVPLYSKVAIHPGEMLKDEIEARRIKKKDFATAVGLLPHHLSELFNGKRTINALLALKLEKELGIDAEYWLRLRNRYELTLAKNSLTSVK